MFPHKQKPMNTILLSVLSFGLACSLTAAEVTPAKPASSSTPGARADVKAEAPAKTRKVAGYPFRGKVGAIDADKWTLTVTTKNAKRVLPVSKKAKIVKNGKPAKLADGKVGEEVAGYIKKLEGDKVEITSIRFGPKPEAPAKEGKEEKAVPATTKPAPAAE